MFPRVEPQSFTRFLISAGVFLCVVAVLVPALVLRDTGLLEITQRRLDALTPLARHEIHHRQQMAHDVARIMPVVAGGVLLLGIGLVVVPLRTLRTQEQRADRREAVELRRLEQQSAGDRRQELEASVREVFVEVSEPAPAAHPRWDRDTLMQHIAMVEANILQRVEAVASPDYEMRQRVKIDGAARLLLDGLLVSRTGAQPDVVLETKFSTLETLQPRMRTRLNRVLAFAARYSAGLGRPVAGWFILAVDDAVPDDVLAAARATANELAAGLVVWVGRERDIPQIAFPDFTDAALM